MVHRRVACSNAAMWKLPSPFRNCIRFNDARLQAVSSRNMYSEQGLDALMRPLCGQVCQSLMVVSNCTPGSAHCHAAVAIFSQRSRAPMVLYTFLSVRRISFQGPSFFTASMNSLAIRTELLEFWPDTVR